MSKKRSENGGKYSIIASFDPLIAENVLFSRLNYKMFDNLARKMIEARLILKNKHI